MARRIDAATSVSNLISHRLFDCPSKRKEYLLEHLSKLVVQEVNRFLKLAINRKLSQ